MKATDANQQIAMTALEEIKCHLERRKEEIYSEIKSYPPPIPACDAQFNYLLELRNAVADELSQVSSLLDDNAASDPIHKVESFLAGSMLLHKQTKMAFQERLHFEDDRVTR